MFKHRVELNKADHWTMFNVFKNVFQNVDLKSSEFMNSLNGHRANQRG